MITRIDKKIPFFLHVPRSAGSYFTRTTQFYLKNLFENKKNNTYVGYIRLDDPTSSLFVNVKFNSDYWLHDKNLKTANGQGRKVDDNSLRSRYRTCGVDTLRGYLKNGEANLLSMKTLTNPNKEITIRKSVFFGLSLCDEFGYETVKVATLRDPIERTISLFNYLSSSESEHEITHHKEKQTFQQWVLDCKLDNNWVVRNFSGNLSGSLNKYWVANAASFLRENKFHLFKTKECSKAVNFSLQSCYGERVSSLSKNFFKNNSSGGVSIRDLASLNSRAKKILTETTVWDQALYNELFPR